jgi:hypothetical protein
LVRRRGATAGADSEDDQTPRKRDIVRSVGYFAAALIGVWVLQAVVAPLIPRATEIPYSEFKARLTTGQITDVTATPSS